MTKASECVGRRRLGAWGVRGMWWPLHDPPGPASPVEPGAPPNVSVTESPIDFGLVDCGARYNEFIRNSNDHQFR